MISASRLATAIGLLGLLPFVLMAAIIAMGVVPEFNWTRLFYLYSAGILAFMAGVYWPIALQIGNGHVFPMSPIKAILLSQLFFIAAGVGVLVPVGIQSVLFPLAYAWLYWVDLARLRAYWPVWYLRLRLVLTVVATLCQIAVGIEIWMG